MTFKPLILTIGLTHVQWSGITHDWFRHSETP